MRDMSVWQHHHLWRLRPVADQLHRRLVMRRFDILKRAAHRSPSLLPAVKNLVAGLWRRRLLPLLRFLCRFLLLAFLLLLLTTRLRLLRIHFRLFRGSRHQVRMILDHVIVPGDRACGAEARAKMTPPLLLRVIVDQVIDLLVTAENKRGSWVEKS